MYKLIVIIILLPLLLLLLIIIIILIIVIIILIIVIMMMIIIIILMIKMITEVPLRIVPGQDQPLAESPQAGCIIYNRHLGLINPLH